ncbi:SDR family NAD(P)-dependent oxidoreductase [Sorangium sp. So ce296]|uniref:SDR family NAD(P)-dependent oxidoreductase n=1 Tax=Sorangium sp. So ce296 TaxID=3133296 RepID=UPI003F5EC927
MGQIVLITGASSGMGLATAVACAQAGHEVVATMRRPERRGPLEEAARARGCASTSRGSTSPRPTRRSG